MKYLKSFVSYFVNENANPRETDFIKKLEWWNKNYSDMFKFLNDKAGVPNELETTEVPGKNGATYQSIAQVGLNNLVELLKEFPEAKVEIDAHTSSPAAGQAWGGSNEKLSQARAENMKKYLVSKGIDESRIKAVGKGFSEPLVADDKDNPEAQLKNRRATVKLDGTFAPSAPAETNDAKFKGVQLSLNLRLDQATIAKDPSAKGKSIGEYFGIQGQLDPKNPKYPQIKEIYKKALTVALQGKQVDPSIDMIARSIQAKKFTLDEFLQAMDNGMIQIVR